MALLKDGVWGIVSGTEKDPGETAGADVQAKFVAKRDRALAIIVLAIDPKLLYLIGDPQDPAVVWTKLANQFQKRTWANKLELRRKLFALRLKEGDPMQDHIKAMTEVFDDLSVIDEPVKEDDRVVYPLASLPDSYNVLVTALEASEEVPKLAVVTERLLHEEKKMKIRSDISAAEEAMVSKHHVRGPPRCYNCGKVGHVTFVDDCTHYTWVYMLKHKSEVFNCFCEWKAQVEKFSGRPVKALRTDNGGEYTSMQFKN